MGSLSDDRKKRDEERRIAGLKKEIQDLEVELKEYEAAKEKVQNAKANCNTEVPACHLLRRKRQRIPRCPFPLLPDGKVLPFHT